MLWNFVNLIYAVVVNAKNTSWIVSLTWNWSPQLYSYKDVVW